MGLKKVDMFPRYQVVIYNYHSVIPGRIYIYIGITYSDSMIHSSYIYIDISTVYFSVCRPVSLYVEYIVK